MTITHWTEWSTGPVAADRSPWLAAEVKSATFAPFAVDGRTVEGTNRPDQLSGGAGDDTIFGRGGADRITGGDGADTIQGNDGADVIFGSAGDDILLGDSFWDGADEATIERGDDQLYGGAGDDRLFGNLGDDLLSGGADDDYLDGRGGNDDLRGGGGDDTLLGLNGNDDLRGGAGDDLLDDGAGVDEFWGGSGADTFIISRREDLGRDEGGENFPGYGIGNDRIYDFDLAERDLLGFQFIDESIAGVRDNGRDTIITISDGERVTLVGFSGQDFQNGLRFDSLADIEALSQARFGYDAILY